MARPQAAASAAVVTVQPRRHRVAAEVDDVAAPRVQRLHQRGEDEVERGAELLGATAFAELARQGLGERGEAGDVDEQRGAGGQRREVLPARERPTPVSRDVGLGIVPGQRLRQRIPSAAGVPSRHSLAPRYRPQPRSTCEHQAVSVHAGVLGNRSLLRSLLSFGFAFTAEWAFTVGHQPGRLRRTAAPWRSGWSGSSGWCRRRCWPRSSRRTPTGCRVSGCWSITSVVRGLATLAAAPVLLVDGPTVVVYALAVVSTVAFTPFRASHSALMPSLCRTPDELASVNVARGALDSVSVIVGPLVAALLVDGGRRRGGVRVRRGVQPRVGRPAGPSCLRADRPAVDATAQPPRRGPRWRRRGHLQRRGRRGGRPRRAAGRDPWRVHGLRPRRRPRPARPLRVERRGAPGRGRHRRPGRQPAVHPAGRQPRDDPVARRRGRPVGRTPGA